MNQRTKKWLPVFLWTFLIYSTLSIIRPVCDYLQKTIPFSASINGLIIFTLVVLAGLAIKKIPMKKPSTYVLMGGLIVVYAYFLITMELPAEKIHFLEYGFLAFLSYRAIDHDVKGPKAYLWAFLLTGILGLIDEGIQNILPNRYYELRDVGLNVLSGGLGLVWTYLFKK